MMRITMSKRLRVCPTFKMYWIENGKVVTIRRLDHDKPFALPHHIFESVKRLFPNFQIREHVVKFKDDGDLILLSLNDTIRLEFSEAQTELLVYIYSSKKNETTDLQSQIASMAIDGKPRPIIEAGSSNDNEDADSTRKRTIETTSQDNESKKSTNTDSTGNKAISSSDASPEEILHTFTCGFCHTEILSNFYMCLSCPDSVLCEACLGMSMHSAHVMSRFPSNYIGLFGLERLKSFVQTCSNELSDVSRIARSDENAKLLFL